MRGIRHIEKCQAMLCEKFRPLYVIKPSFGINVYQPKGWLSHSLCSLLIKSEGRNLH